MSTVIWWIRRDLRLFDNPALHLAQQQGERIIPLFILDPALQNSPTVGERRKSFLHEGLAVLDQQLRAIGSQLIIRAGRPFEVLPAIFQESQASLVVAQMDVSPYAQERDKLLSQLLPIQWTAGVGIRPVELVLKDDNQPYTVFTPYKKKWFSYPPLSKNDLHPAPTQLAPPGLSNLLPIVTQTSALFPAGEPTGRGRLTQFVRSQLLAYADQRDFVDLDGTSSLSPYLRFGMVSPREAAVLALEAQAAAESEPSRKGAETWLSELIWREFYLQILFHFPHVQRGAFRPEYNAIPWRNDPAEFEAWCQGQTGYPIVDAGMRQLNQTGWMHNRARMITASFLVKDLLINWQWGEKYFMQQLFDGDPASNNGGWQWTAGTGTDAAPYFRIFNPVSQSLKFDPHGNYIRQWMPELARLPGKYIHAPWEAPPAVQQSAGCVVGQNYPRPVVDHSQARERVLAAYKI